MNDGITQLSIVTTTLPQGAQNAGYNTMLAATGGITPYTWSVVARALPLGLQLNTSPVRSGIRGAGVSNFTVQVADAEGPPATASKALSITINPAVPLQITTTSLPNGVAGTLYSAPITAIGGVYPYTWSVIAGKVPTANFQQHYRSPRRRTAQNGGRVELHHPGDRYGNSGERHGATQPHD